MEHEIQYPVARLWASASSKWNAPCFKGNEQKLRYTRDLASSINKRLNLVCLEMQLSECAFWGKSNHWCCSMKYRVAHISRNAEPVCTAHLATCVGFHTPKLDLCSFSSPVYISETTDVCDFSFLGLPVNKRHNIQWAV